MNSLELKHPELVQEFEAFKNYSKPKEEFASFSLGPHYHSDNHTHNSNILMVLGGSYLVVGFCGWAALAWLLSP